MNKLYIYCKVDPFCFTAIDASLEEIERHLEMGKMFLSKGQFSDALTHYHAAVGKLIKMVLCPILSFIRVRLGPGKLSNVVPSSDCVFGDGEITISVTRFR